MAHGERGDGGLLLVFNNDDEEGENGLERVRQRGDGAP